jgi:hypothetical protein|tara:strand:+ start:2773 stop:3012 length:240 start_codon:yes stop_codon:yes gene_type:complete
MENNTQVPIPDRAASAPQVYYFYRLGVGDHMDIPTQDPKELIRVRGAASIYGKRNGKLLVTRSIINQEGDKILRIWRKE